MRTIYKTVLITLFTGASLMAQDVYATFNVEANKEATITVDARGLVEEIYVKVGQKVKKYDKLLKLDNLDLIKSKAISQAELDALKVELKYAKKSLERFKKLKDVVDNEQYDQVAYKVELLQAKYAASVAGLNYKQTMINKTYLRAPFNGVVTDKYIQVGEMAGNKCFTVMDTSRVKLLLSFDEKYWAKVKKGSKFVYRVDGLDNQMSGTISKVYPSADHKSRTITAEVITTGLLPGLFGDGFIQVK
jgi:RND family efflux transporter MFP subunit